MSKVANTRRPTATVQDTPVTVIDHTSSTEALYKHAMETWGTTSARIRGLDALGVKRGTIAKILGKRYQHVRNVLITPLTGSNK